MNLKNVEHDIPDLNNLGYKMVERDGNSYFNRWQQIFHENAYIQENTLMILFGCKKKK